MSETRLTRETDLTKMRTNKESRRNPETTFRMKELLRIKLIDKLGRCTGVGVVLV